MSDPQLHVDVDVDEDPVEAVVVAAPEQETWLVKTSQPRWQVWRDHNRRRPLSRAEKRGRVALAVAGTIVGVLGFVGAASYAIQYQGLHREAVDQVQAFGGVQPPHWMVQNEQNSSSDLQQAIDRTAGAARGNSGLIGVVNGEVAGVSPTAARAAADKGFVADALRTAKKGDTWDADTYVSGSSVCVYTVGTIDWRGESAVVVDVFDLTPDLNRMNGAYLTYGLVCLGAAGATGGVVWWRLGRQRNKKVEPDEV
jgi:hypothetical protein